MASDLAATLRIHLERKSQPIGAYDTLIAGHALALHYPLVSRNHKEFQRVPELQILGW